MEPDLAAASRANKRSHSPIKLRDLFAWVERVVYILQLQVKLLSLTAIAEPMKSFFAGLSMLTRSNTLIYASPARRIFGSWDYMCQRP
jgi:hypothetical protein